MMFRNSSNLLPVRLGCRTPQRTRAELVGRCEHVQSLADALARIGSGGDVEETLIGRGVLDYGGGFSLHGEHDRALALL